MNDSLFIRRLLSRRGLIGLASNIAPVCLARGDDLPGIPDHCVHVEDGCVHRAALLPSLLVGNLLKNRQCSFSRKMQNFFTQNTKKEKQLRKVELNYFSLRFYIYLLLNLA